MWALQCVLLWPCRSSGPQQSLLSVFIFSSNPWRAYSASNPLTRCFRPWQHEGIVFRLVHHHSRGFSLSFLQPTVCSLCVKEHFESDKKRTDYTPCCFLSRYLWKSNKKSRFYREGSFGIYIRVRKRKKNFSSQSLWKSTRAEIDDLRSIF